MRNPVRSILHGRHARRSCLGLSTSSYVRRCRHVLQHRRPVAVRLFDEPEALHRKIFEESEATLAISLVQSESTLSSEGMCDIAYLTCVSEQHSF